MPSSYTIRLNDGLLAASTALGTVSYDSKASAALTLALLLAYGAATPMHREVIDVRKVMTPGTAGVEPSKAQHSELIDEMLRAFDVLRIQKDLDADVKAILYRRMDQHYL